MKLFGFLSRRGRQPAVQPGPAVSLSTPGGIDFLRAGAGMSDRAEPIGAAPPQIPVPDPAYAMPRDVLEDHARQAEQRLDWHAAEALWRTARARFPDVFHGWTGGAAALAALGRAVDAGQLLTEAAGLFPYERAIPHHHARLAAGHGDWPTAELHWRSALTFSRREWWIYTELAGVLEHQGRLDDAEAILAEGRTRSDEPGEISLFIASAKLAWRRDDLAGAVTRWGEIYRRFPISEQTSSGMYQALMRLAEHDPAAAEMAHRELGLTSSDQDMRALMLGFESLGGTGPAGGCEFGGVQRHHGAEPLGLFRWATVTPANLIACLDARLAGIGDTGTTTVTPHTGQWEIQETAYGTSMHSFVSCEDETADRMVVLAGRRMSFLKDKLIADLESAAKIFVLTAGGDGVTAAQTAALSRSIGAFGPNRLLIVCPVDDAHAEGEIVPADPGILLGYIDFAGNAGVDARRPVWESLCRAVVARPDTPAEQPAWAGLAAQATDISRHRECALLAEDQNDWDAALAGWRAVLGVTADRPDGHEGVLRSLRRLGRLAEVARILPDAMARFPESPELLIETARFAALVGLKDDALRVWDQVRRRFPDRGEGYVEAADILRSLGRPEEAATVADHGRATRAEIR